MTEMTLRGHKVAKGKAKGEALVSHAPISYLGGINPQTGVVMEKDHELEGACVAGKILIYPTGKGSTASAYQLYELVCSGKAPKAIINLRADPVTVIGAIIGGVPMMDKLEKNPIEAIKSGDFVEVDADSGIVIVKSA